ncbi:MAG TPA: ATP-dependent metallopeptidase FtsH/Yme1/Tma family protein, partial [Saprospiraceae bacterium]|nr:ATP-dependent metallopeptidase FtsH/Yme1/Tma family protein [Saprospiraceae bacterium]
MENNNNNSNNNNENKPKKFQKNSYWIYAIFLVILIALQLITYMTGGVTIDITETEFEKMVKDNAVEKIEIVDRNLVQVYLKEEALKRDPYKTEFKDKTIAETVPQYKFKLLSPDN